MSDVERLMVSRQLQVDAVRRVGRRVCQANRAILQQADDPALVSCWLSALNGANVEL